MSRRSSEDHVVTSRRGSEDSVSISRRSSIDQAFISSRRVSIAHPNHLPTELEIQLLYGYFTDLSAQRQRETSSDLWHNRETFERQLSVVQSVIENNEEKMALLLRMSAPSLIDAAIKAAAYQNNTALVHALHKKTTDRSAALFGYALGGHFDQVDEIFDKCRLKMREGLTPEMLRYADLLTAAAAGAALRGDDVRVSQYQRAGAHLFQIAMAYGLANNVHAFNQLHRANPPYQRDMKKAVLMGFAMGNHYESALHASRDFTQNTDAIVLGLGIRNAASSELFRVFSDISLSLPFRLLGCLLGGHVMRVEELRHRLSEDAAFQFVLCHLAVLSGRPGYAAHLAQDYRVDLSLKIADFNIPLLLHMGASDGPMEAPEKLRRNSRRGSESTETIVDRVLVHDTSEGAASGRRDSHLSGRRRASLFPMPESSGSTLPPIDPGRHVRFR